MKSVFKTLLISTVLVGAGLAASAQPNAAPQPEGVTAPIGGDPARTPEMLDRHQRTLKSSLKLTVAQEAAWATYVSALQPEATMATRSSAESRAKLREEMDKLTTPQRIEQMNAAKAQRDAELAGRNEATLAFYAALTAGQQKVFDSHSTHPGWTRSLLDQAAQWKTGLMDHLPWSRNSSGLKGQSAGQPAPGSSNEPAGS